MLLMIEEGIRGGITQVIAKFLQGNNKYIKDYDGNKDSLFLQYLDLNGLYAWAMRQKLPHKGFEFCKDLRYINQKSVKNYDEEFSEKGYILEVDVKYPKKLQDEHKDLPFLSEKITCNFCDKTRHAVHIKLLQQALNHRLKLKKVHRVTKFKQRAWMKEYIMLNIEVRKKASNDQ